MADQDTRPLNDREDERRPPRAPEAIPASELDEDEDDETTAEEHPIPQ